jgi:hypothetical protein
VAQAPDRELERDFSASLILAQERARGTDLNQVLGDRFGGATSSSQCLEQILDKLGRVDLDAHRR